MAKWYFEVLKHVNRRQMKGNDGRKLTEWTRLREMDSVSKVIKFIEKFPQAFVSFDTPESQSCLDTEFKTDLVVYLSTQLSDLVGFTFLLIQIKSSECGVRHFYEKWMAHNDYVIVLNGQTQELEMTENFLLQVLWLMDEEHIDNFDLILKKFFDLNPTQFKADVQSEYNLLLASMLSLGYSH